MATTDAERNDNEGWVREFVDRPLTRTVIEALLADRPRAAGLETGQGGLRRRRLRCSHLDGLAVDDPVARRAQDHDALRVLAVVHDLGGLAHRSRRRSGG
jgi:hypothetical protein